ncbi:MAG: hypothetical protein JWL65_3845 [Gammaproteobacteria bacterium]|nr:hypothetical protein [Gammaproteobacteria bacterium]
MNSQMRILYLEDDPKDAELVRAMLETGGFGCQVTRVESQVDFCASLEWHDFNLILADYTLPSFDGISALKIAARKRPEVPFIFVSGTLGEEVAIEALTIGATDYVLKTRLSRLVPSVVRALREVTERADRKRAEESAQAECERLEQLLRQAAKMEAVGQFAGSIAHDFNNILGAILGYGERAQSNLPEGGAARHQVDQMMCAGARGKALVDRILNFSRSGMGERAPLQVQPVVEETLELLAASLPADVQLERRLHALDTAVVGDATQFHQVVMNLCTNALHAMKRGGVLTVVLERIAVRERRLLSHGTLSAGRYVHLSVSDTGNGIPPAVLEHMFDPFFTTKRVGEGTGLGLALVHGIVADFGGVIDVATQVGVGTTFTIWLPGAGQMPTLLAEPARELPRGNGETVMILDDERALVALAEETLAELGYEPVGFDSGLCALQAFRAEPDRFNLVLTDETMPDLTGAELACKIRQLRPEVSIILMSGYSDTQLSARAQAAGVIDVLRKPLVRRDIAEAVARALQARARPIESSGRRPAPR